MPRPCLLIVDDEPDMVAFVSDVAEDMGFECASAGSARECLEIYGTVKPAGIVLDVVMPDMDGIELIQALAKNNFSAPIIAMSGYQQIYLDILESLAGEHNAVVVGTLNKPFTARDLQKMLKQILETLD